RHIVYLSRYLPEREPLFSMADAEVIDYSLGHLRRMFPALRPEWVVQAHVWRARHAQPVVERGYRELIPPRETPLSDLWLASMAQIYPEDRGTNYAVREGRAVARDVAARLGRTPERLRATVTRDAS